MHIAEQIRPCHGLQKEDQGWILALALFFLIVIQGLALASLSLAKYQIKSSSAFFRITSGNHFSARSASTPVVCISRLSAPEGWDQACFSTELKETLQGSERCYSWRIADSGFPGTCTDEILLASARPYLIMIVDDSATMNKSSGRDYDNDALFLKRPEGEIVRISDVSEIEGNAVVQEGTFFKGSWGNLHMKAPMYGAFTGAMPGWTHSYSSARSLFDSLELTVAAVLSTSHGTVQGLTHDYRKLAGALDGLHPDTHEAKLSETLYQAVLMFPKDCPTSRDIVLITSGLAVNDGNLPEWLKDFDGDGNPSDKAILEEGCHCLDDVAAYAFSQGIKVHVIGPDTEFLRNVASKGGGKFMPGRACFAPDLSFVCQSMVMYGGKELVPKNELGLFHPPWLETDSFTAFRPGALDPSSLVSCPGLTIRGLASTLSPCGSNLYCTTTRNTLLKVSMPSGDLDWLISGIGGVALTRGNRIIAGPNSSGDIYCIDDGPSVNWLDKGASFDASSSIAYIAQESAITARHLATGVLSAYADSGHDISCLRYDAGSGTVLAGTKDGLIFSYTHDLKPNGIIVPGSGDAIRDIRTFVWRKKSFILSLDRKNIACNTLNELRWAVSISEGMPTTTLTADKKVYVCIWKEGGPCGGIDTGSSMLMILDALTGECTAKKELFSGKAFGPTVDIIGKRLVYTSWNGKVHEENVSDLQGLTWLSAGKRIERPDL